MYNVYACMRACMCVNIFNSIVCGNMSNNNLTHHLQAFCPCVCASGNSIVWEKMSNYNLTHHLHCSDGRPLGVPNFKLEARAEDRLTGNKPTTEKVNCAKFTFS